MTRHPTYFKTSQRSTKIVLKLIQVYLVQNDGSNNKKMLVYSGDNKKFLFRSTIGCLQKVRTHFKLDD